MGETTNRQTEASHLSGGTQEDRGGAAGKMGEAEERGLIYTVDDAPTDLGYDLKLWPDTSLCQLSNADVAIQIGASLYGHSLLF